METPRVVDTKDLPQKLMEVRFYVNKDVFVVYVLEHNIHTFESGIQRCVEIRAEEKAKVLAKQYVSKAISNGLEFLHNLR